PPEGRSKFLDINKFQPGEKETVFLEEQLKQKTTVIDSNTGNASRVYAVGVTNQNSISHADLDKHIREIIAPKFS
ncbi:MAG: hypothetical protein K8R21_05245, partial [Leptospira sp.]|nr:hypothetical protein [Leptospira sp.]